MKYATMIFCAVCLLGTSAYAVEKSAAPLPKPEELVDAAMAKDKPKEDAAPVKKEAAKKHKKKKSAKTRKKSAARPQTEYKGQLQ